MEKSALKISKGVEQVSSLNPNLKTNVTKNRKNILTVDEYVQGILKKDLLILSKGITLVESNKPEHHRIAQEIIEKILPFTGKSIRIGITGVPGVGKSTFIEAFGEYIISKNRSLAVLAIDPTSQRSHGSILGDKTRMENLSKNPKAFIRPSPAGGSLGGVARKTRESTLLCEAAGFDTILIETVGVGQSETAVHSMVDFFLLLMLAGAGDELQGIKRGIMEIADMIAINKADGDNFHKATGAKSEYTAALHLFPPTESKWVPKVVTCSSTENTGIDQVWNHIEEYVQLTQANGFLKKNRKEQIRFWFREFLSEAIQEDFYGKNKRREKAKTLEEKVVKGEITSLTAIRMLME